MAEWFMASGWNAFAMLPRRIQNLRFSQKMVSFAFWDRNANEGGVLENWGFFQTGLTHSGRIRGAFATHFEFGAVGWMDGRGWVP